ncbi:hypothetical protein [Sinorhizobium meliloti]|nr:hypothetical protein [Sinorhizobium meliloti]
MIFDVALPRSMEISTAAADVALTATVAANSLATIPFIISPHSPNR